MHKRSYSRMKGLFRDFLLCWAAISEKVYVPLDLVVLFHIVNIMVKSLTQFFSQISIVLWKIVQVWPQKVRSLTDICALSWWKLFNFILIFCTLVFSRKFITTNFSHCEVDSSTSLSASSNIWSFMNSLI